MEELVDILVTTYNTNEKYLKKQIESILKQTYENIKIYISDDNSPNPRVAEILKQYEKIDERIKLFIQPKNLGYNKNFEFLLNQSKANYIMFSDHDDIWHKEKVEKSLAKIKEKNVDMVYCNCHQIDENGKIIQENYFKYKNVPLIKKHSKLAISRYAGIGCSQLFTKDVKEKALPFKSSVMAHDWLIGFIANENKGIAHIDKPLFGYRLHQSNVFGGRSLSQNLKRWKEENGKSYQSYLKYRKENVIDKAYLTGAQMCLDYCKKEEDKIFLEKIIKYYKKLEESKFINLHFISYFKFLAGKNMIKKMVKEFVIFHFPIIGYITYCLE